MPWFDYYPQKWRILSLLFFSYLPALVFLHFISQSVPVPEQEQDGKATCIYVFVYREHCVNLRCQWEGTNCPGPDSPIQHQDVLTFKIW